MYGETNKHAVSVKQAHIGVVFRLKEFDDK